GLPSGEALFELRGVPMVAQDFAGRQVIVVGGASGIGNATARMFLDAGAQVHVTGTRESPEAYGPEAAARLAGLAYSQLDVSAPGAVDRWEPGVGRLDVLVASQ